MPVIHAYQLKEKVRAICGADRLEIVIRKGYNHGGIDERWNEPDINNEMFAFFDKKIK